MLTYLVQTARGPVEYSEAGAGNPLLYFHGSGVTGDVMLRVESPLIDDGFRLIIPNRPGYGRTPLAPHGSAAECGNVVAALLDQLDIRIVDVIGSSGGAAFAASFAFNHPDRSQSLVLLCPQLHRWDHKRWMPASSRWTLPFIRRKLTRKVLLALYRMQLPRMSVKKFLRMESGIRYTDVASDPTTLDLCRTTLDAMRHGTQHAGFENDFLVFINEDVIANASKLQTPTLIIHDVMDPMAPVDHVDWFVSRFHDCHRVSVHCAGHLIWVGLDADAMHRARVQFLRENARDR